MELVDKQHVTAPHTFGNFLREVACFLARLRAWRQCGRCHRGWLDAASGHVPDGPWGRETVVDIHEVAKTSGDPPDPHLSCRNKGIHAGTDMSLTDWVYTCWPGVSLTGWVYMLARCVSNRLGIHAGQVCL